MLSRQKLKTRQSGLAMIELSLILPFFLLLVFASINYGVALYNQAVITNASREAAREGISFRVPAPTHSDITAKALAYCQSHLITFGTQATPEVTIEEPGGRLPGESLRVTIRYAFKGITFMSGLSPGALAATSTMTFE